MNGNLTNLKDGEPTELGSVSVIGRSAESTFHIADPRVSRRHAMIRKQENGYWLFDLGSFNGSYLNGSRVTAARQLKDGDVLNFADHEFRFNQEGNSLEEQIDDMGHSTIALIRSRPVIILVSDIQGFTTLSEQLTPDDLAQVIGSWYGDCELVIDKYGATVDKFIGDCVLAYWTEVNETTLKQAALAARDLHRCCKKIFDQKREIFEASGQSFGAGVALHTGKVAYGGMSQGEFTLVGDPVNLTFRIESMTRTLDCEIVTTADFVNAAPALRNCVNNLGTHQVKGRSEPVEIWGFTSFPEE